MYVTFACQNYIYLQHFGMNPIPPWASLYITIPTVGVLLRHINQHSLQEILSWV